MKAILIALLSVLVAGCEYTVPLTAKPEIKIDKKLLGLWGELGEGEQTDRLLVLPLGDTEYLVSFPSGADKSMFARACLVDVTGEKLVQLRWFGTARGEVPGDRPEDRAVYQYASFSLTGDVLTVQLLNPDVVPKTIATTEELRRAIESGMDQPDLFRDPMHFQRVTP